MELILHSYPSDILPINYVEWEQFCLLMFFFLTLSFTYLILWHFVQYYHL